MIDYFAIALTHGLIAFAAWLLLSRDDLDDDEVRSEDASRARSGAEQSRNAHGKTGVRKDRPWLKNQAGGEDA